MAASLKQKAEASKEFSAVGESGKLSTQPHAPLAHESVSIGMRETAVLLPQVLHIHAAKHATNLDS